MDLNIKRLLVLFKLILAKSPTFSGTLPGFRLISSTTPDLPQPSRDSVYLVVQAKNQLEMSQNFTNMRSSVAEFSYFKFSEYIAID